MGDKSIEFDCLLFYFMFIPFAIRENSPNDNHSALNHVVSKV